MSINLTQYSQDPSIFTNMMSRLNNQSGIWPLNLILPAPDVKPQSVAEKLPSIFIEEPAKKCKKVTACPHITRKHYAKDMCDNCYHREGRKKSAWNCEHKDKKHYAKGKCQCCYLREYNQMKKRSEY